MTGRICSGSSAGALNYTAIVNDAVKGNNLVTDVAAKCHREINSSQLGWGHSIGKVTFSTVGFLTPIISSVAIPTLVAYEYLSNGGVTEYVTGGAIKDNFLADASQPTRSALEKLLALTAEGAFKVVNMTYTSAADLTYASASLALESGSPTHLLAGGTTTALAMVGASRFGLSPLDMTRTVAYTATQTVTSAAQTAFNYVTWMYGASVLATANAIKNSVANSYDKKAQQVEELTKNNHACILRSLTEAYSGIGQAIDAKLKEADTLVKKYALAQDVARIERKLPEIKRAFQAVGLSDTEMDAVLEKLNGSIRQIDIVLSPDLEHSDKAAVHNYDLLVNLPQALGVENCVPMSVHACLKEVRENQLGWGYKAKSIADAVSSSVIATAVPLAIAKASENVCYMGGYDPLKALSDLAVEQGVPAGVKEVNIALTATVIGTAMIVGGTRLNRKWAAFNQSLSNAKAAVTENIQKAQGYLDKVFNDVAVNLRPEHKAVVKKRLPLWKAEIEKYPHLNAEAALQSIKEALANMDVQATAAQKAPAAAKVEVSLTAPSVSSAAAAA